MSYYLLLASLVLFLLGYRSLPPHEASLVSIGAAFVLYVGIAVSNARMGQWSLFVVWLAYSVSQCGFFAAEFWKEKH